MSGAVAAHRSTAGHWYRYAAHSRGIDELKASRYQRCVQEPIICSPYWRHAIDVPSSRISVILRIYWRTETGMFHCCTKWKRKIGGFCTHMSPMCSSNNQSARTEAYFRLCATHEYCYSLTYLPSYDPVKSTWGEPRIETGTKTDTERIAEGKLSITIHSLTPEYGCHWLLVLNLN